MSRERQKLAEAETVSNVEGNMCITRCSGGNLATGKSHARATASLRSRTRRMNLFAPGTRSTTKFVEAIEDHITVAGRTIFWYNALYDPSRTQGAITSALCWAHARRQFFELADIAANARRGKKAPAVSPVALEAVKRIDALFDI